MAPAACSSTARFSPSRPTDRMVGWGGGLRATHERAQAGRRSSEPTPVSLLWPVTQMLAFHSSCHQLSLPTAQPVCTHTPPEVTMEAGADAGPQPSALYACARKV